ncbi:hypothetical protein K440DRAFT_613876 [Wilcoxina mikolae CBS 423.85]|nr:hypothetical protein K440DRAFT_613876 [Wilcoxina mikolae CBS 423.85]
MTIGFDDEDNVAMFCFDEFRVLHISIFALLCLLATEIIVRGRVVEVKLLSCGGNEWKPRLGWGKQGAVASKLGRGKGGYGESYVSRGSRVC